MTEVAAASVGDVSDKQSGAIRSPTVSRQDVISAFRFFLGRSPENDAVIDLYCSRNWSLDDLRRAFMSSAEFKEKQPALVSNSSQKPLDWPKSDVEVDVSEDQMLRMIRHIEDSWEKLGEAVPHWSVLTSDQYKPEQIKETQDAFYETGSASVKFMQAAAERCGVDMSRYRSCFELGCGVGRVTIWLAKLFDSVVAADISRPHLDLAEEAVASRGIRNVEFRHVNRIGSLAGLTGFDCFFSVIVLQHNPPPVMKLLLSRILSSLNRGGMAYFQITTHVKNYNFRAADYLSTVSSKGQMEIHALPQQVIFELARQNGCRVLEVREDNWAGSPLIISNSFLILKG